MNGTEFVGLYDVQYPRIFRYLLWRLRQRDAAEEVTARAGPAVERDPEELVIGRLEHATVRACVDALNPEQRKVLLLRIVAGLSASEVAETLGTTDVMVRNLQLRGLRTLRTFWKEAEANAGRGGTGAQ